MTSQFDFGPDVRCPCVMTNRHSKSAFYPPFECEFELWSVIQDYSSLPHLRCGDSLQGVKRPQQW